MTALTNRDHDVVSIKGYTHGELTQAFNEIQNPTNWKLPIDAWIHPNRFDICNEACAYFTGSRLRRSQWRGERAVRVVADGYYRTIGA